MHIPLRGLSILSDNGGMGMGFEVFWDQGDRDNLLDPPYPKIGGGRIYSEFSRPRGPPLTFVPLYLLGLEHETCGDSTVRVYQGDIVLSPYISLISSFISLRINN